MRYSFEFKVACIDKYRQGLWPVTPEGIKEENFHQTIRKWARIEDALGLDALKHKNFNKEWTAEEKLKLISRVLAGESLKSVAYSVGIENTALRKWVTKYKTKGYNGLVDMKKRSTTKGASNEKDYKSSATYRVRKRRTYPP